jgi:fumarate hydratase class I
MDKFTDFILEHTGLLGMIGKAERGPTGIEAIRKHGAVYLMAVGGAAYLVSRRSPMRAWWPSRSSAWRRSTSSRCKDMPVSVAVDTQGQSVHQTGPEHWRSVIEEQALELI